MSKFDFLATQLNQYDALASHQDAELAARLKDVQHWQKQRMQNMHQNLFSHKNHWLMADYFLNRLYGGDDFAELALQLRRIINHAGIVEKVIPESALATGDAGVELAHLSISLDEALAAYLLQRYPAQQPITNEMMIDAFRACKQQHERIHQLELLKMLGHKLDRYMRSRMVKTAFKLAKGPAYRYHVEPIYDFIDQGFKAMEPLDSAEQFIVTFIEKECRFLDAVYDAHPDPFSVVV